VSTPFIALQQPPSYFVANLLTSSSTSSARFCAVAGVAEISAAIFPIRPWWWRSEGEGSYRAAM